MRNRVRGLALSTGGLVLVGAAWPAVAAVAIDGLRDGGYGAALAVQTNNTGFGDSTTGSGLSEGGSELDAAYAVIEGANLNLFLSGNLQNNFNHLNIFIADGRAGQNTINAQGGLAPMNGSKFSAGLNPFNATYALDINQGGAPFTAYVNRYDMTATGPAGAPSFFLGSFAPNDGLAHTINGVTFSFNNTNLAGVVGGAPSAADTTNALAVTTGLEVSIPLTLLGSPTGEIKILAAINGGNNGFLSNQFLTGLPTTVNNVGGGGTPYSGSASSKFDFSLTDNQFFTVTVPPTGAINGVWSATGGGSWGTTGNWVGGNVPGAPADSATFGTTPGITTPSTVTLDGGRTVGLLTFNNLANAYTIAQGTGGTLTIDDIGDLLGVNPSISVQAGAHTISAPLALVAGVEANVFASSSLTISGAISGAGGIVKTNDGTLTLAVNNTYTGDTTVLAGTLAIASNTAASTGAITLGDSDADNLPATLVISATGLEITNPITTNRDLASNNNLRTIAASYAGGSSALKGVIALNGGVVFTAPIGAALNVDNVIQDGTDTHGSVKHDVTIGAANGGLITLNAVNTYTGITNVNGGALTIGPAAAIASNTISVAVGASMLIRGTVPATATINANGSVNFQGSTSAAVLTRQLTALNIGTGATSAITASAFPATPAVLDVTTLSFADATSKLEIANNEVRLNGTLATVVPMITSGQLYTLSSGGLLGSLDIDGTRVRVRFTLPGDTDLNGAVDVADLGSLASSYGTTSGAIWAQGDSNYDGAVDVGDLGALASSYGSSLASGPSVDGAALVARGLSSVAAVPEPASLGLLALAATAGLARRRRRDSHTRA